MIIEASFRHLCLLDVGPTISSLSSYQNVTEIIYTHTYLTRSFIHHSRNGLSGLRRFSEAQPESILPHSSEPSLTLSTWEIILTERKRTSSDSADSSNRLGSFVKPNLQRRVALKFVDR